MQRSANLGLQAVSGHAIGWRPGHRWACVRALSLAYVSPCDLEGIDLEDH